jgi:acyl phosphate:glycerol-3-phosphate acyltransferase
METWEGVLWVVGAYLVGTFPSAYLVARARGGSRVMSAARRDASEADAHMLITAHLGGGWSALAATLDVAKGLVYSLVARRFGDLPPVWLALVGGAVVVGHCWPPYARAMAGRGLAAASGVLLALLPVEMVVAGVVILVGIVFRATGLASAVGFAAAATVAAIRGQPAAYVAMAAAILALVLLRRLEGAGEMVRRGIPAGRAVYYRVVWDVSGPEGLPWRRRRGASLQ